MCLQDWFYQTGQIEFHLNIFVYISHDKLCVNWWTTSFVSVWGGAMLHLVAADHPICCVTCRCLVSHFFWNLAQHAQRKINHNDNILIFISDTLPHIVFVDEEESSWFAKMQHV